MTAIDGTPSNKNFLSPLNFKFQIKRSPTLNFFIQKVNIPSIVLPTIEIPTQFNPIPVSGNKLEYGEFAITFKVDEDFANYLELHNWIRALGFPEQHEEYRVLSVNPEYTGEGLVSDLQLIVLNSAKNPNFEFTFRNAFPFFLSDIELDTTNTDVDYVTASARFKYLLFDVTKIT